MQPVVPALRITNYERSKAFYQALGFQVDWEHRFEPNFPVFMEISREGMSLLSNRTYRRLSGWGFGAFLRGRCG